MADKSLTPPSSLSDLSKYATSLPTDAKLRYSTKLLYNNGTEKLPDPYALTEKWDPNPSTWPDLTFGDIYLYLIDTPSIYTKESMKAYKSLDAYMYVVSGHVQEISSHQVLDNCPFIALKAKVTPSQRARDKPHQPWKNTGTVYCAHCTCMAGLGEVCSHVGALLFKVEMAVKMGLTQTSSTSKVCQWNNTFRREVTPTTVTDIFQSIKGKRTKEVQSVQASGSATLPSKQLLDQLFAIVPEASFFTSIKPSINNQPQNSPTQDKYPQLLSTLQQPHYNPDDINVICSNTYTAYNITPSQAANLETATRDQSVSPLWFQHRMGRVTGSKAHDVLTRKSTTKPDNLVKRIAGYATYDLSKKEAVKWGIDHEEECRRAYQHHQQKGHASFTCEDSGFVVKPAHPFLGASPDGIVSCQCCGKGTVEIKCPYKHRDITVQEAAIKDKDFCLDATLKLKKKHRYFTQIQMQMFVTNCHYTDFVVYTKCQPAASMVIVRVLADDDFISTLIETCEDFVKTFVIRELITRHFENEPVQNKNNKVMSKDDAQTATWCICSEPEYGRMIKCDDNECPYEWFHYRCVNIRRKPRGQWFCTSCEP
ncbi:uncharacterized protein LOC110443137 [Mizuhopecten yessoensis]|uniref:uncharacterized protein LOC110443137 n=1 Tax=Mizuhopecten yessoensis TaxID=6573 RepID=UPI000B45C2F7|nr:uncharacterized protein LOC110443137 [Mizuhopecten yessoensis]